MHWGVFSIFQAEYRFALGDEGGEQAAFIKGETFLIHREVKERLEFLGLRKVIFKADRKSPLMRLLRKPLIV